MDTVARFQRLEQNNVFFLFIFCLTYSVQFIQGGEEKTSVNSGRINLFHSPQGGSMSAQTSIRNISHKCSWLVNLPLCQEVFS